MPCAQTAFGIVVGDIVAPPTSTIAMAARASVMAIAPAQSPRRPLPHLCPPGPSVAPIYYVPENGGVERSIRGRGEVVDGEVENGGEEGRR